MPIDEVLARVRSSGAVSADDVLVVRRAVYGGEIAVTPDEMETMLAIEEAASRADPGWAQLLDEAGADFIVNQLPPAGYVTEENAAWLVERIAKDGVVKTSRELGVLVHIIDRATSAPGTLAALALQQVELAVMEGRGPLAAGGLERGRISKESVDVLRRILYAYGGNGAVAITRSEAEVLFDLNDATSGAGNDPSWDDLFVKAIASYLLTISGHRPPSREQALSDARWLDAPAEGLGGFFARMTTGGLQGILAAYRETDGAPSPGAETKGVTTDEAAWLAERFGRDGMLKENERALLRFIRDEAPSVPGALKALIDEAA